MIEEEGDHEIKSVEAFAEVIQNTRLGHTRRRLLELSDPTFYTGLTFEERSTLVAELWDRFPASVLLSDAIKSSNDAGTTLLRQIREPSVVMVNILFNDLNFYRSTVGREAMGRNMFDVSALGWLDELHTAAEVLCIEKAGGGYNFDEESWKLFTDLLRASPGYTEEGIMWAKFDELIRATERQTKEKEERSVARLE